MLPPSFSTMFDDELLTHSLSIDSVIPNHSFDYTPDDFGPLMDETDPTGVYGPVKDAVDSLNSTQNSYQRRQPYKIVTRRNLSANLSSHLFAHHTTATLAMNKSYFADNAPMPTDPLEEKFYRTLLDRLPSSFESRDL